eukprot:9505008-Prorocentrum_lima.AAC.1
MTSSLVGSEMCIRDSLRAQHPAGAPTSYGCDAHGRSGSLRAQAKGADAVSYTHLTLPTICSV